MIILPAPLAWPGGKELSPESWGTSARPGTAVLGAKLPNGKGACVPGLAVMRSGTMDGWIHGWIHVCVPALGTEVTAAAL